MAQRRQILQMMTGVAAMPAFTAVEGAPSYPSRTVRIIVGFPPGGPLDIVARLIAPWLASRLGQAIAVENQVGASGNIATAIVAKALADGHRLLLCGPVNTINTTLYEGELDFDFAHDIAPVAAIARVPLVVEVHPSVSAASLPQLIAYARSNPGTLKVAYAGIGTPQHIGIELFKMMSGVDLTLVAYPGSAAALADLVDGKVQVMFDPMPSSLPHIKAGRLRPLAVTSRDRSAVLPDVPVVGDILPGYSAGSWFGIGAPRNTPSAIVEILNKTINAALVDPVMQQRLTELGAAPMPGSSVDFAKFIDDETEKYRQVIKAARIKAR